MNKKDFPIFNNNPGLIYLDSAATAQKPFCVIDAEKNFYETTYASVHRGVYSLSQQSTALYATSREKVRHFLNAKHTHEIIFTKGTTDAINLLAHAFGLENFKKDDEIILSVAEHHANIIPWQEVCKKTGAKLVIIPLHENGELDFEFYVKTLNSKTKLVAITHISNVLGIVNPVKKIVEAAHANNTPVLLDGAQAISHISVDVQAIGCDFYVFSAHKLYGPSGVGVLYGKEKYLEEMEPYQTGGLMVKSVTFEKTEFSALPNKFEAGTPNIAGVIGLGAAIDYVLNIGFGTIIEHEKIVLNKTLEKLRAIDGLRIYGEPDTGVISFSMDCAHPHDVATILDQANIAVRAGHHCAMPLMQFLKVPALTRVSLGIYNVTEDIDALIEGLSTVKKIFSR